MPPLASDGRPVESVPVDALVLAEPEEAPLEFSAAPGTGLPLSAALEPPGPGFEFTRVSRPQPAIANVNASAASAAGKVLLVFILPHGPDDPRGVHTWRRVSRARKKLRQTDDRVIPKFPREYPADHRGRGASV